MNEIFDKIKNSSLTRRSFLATSAAMSLNVVGCGNKLKTTANTTNTKPEEKWVSVACTTWEGCGGRCVNKVLVQDGIVIRQKTDDSHADSPEYPQQRACPKGRVHRKQIFAADRLKYPMKRKHWQPGTGGDRSLRGRDEWVRISWDEALNHIAAEIKRIKENYGNRSIFLDYWGGKPNDYKRVLGLYGGYMCGWGTCSYGSWALTPTNTGFASRGGGYSCNDRFDFLNTDKVIFMGNNPAVSAHGMPTNIYMEAKRNGTKFIGIDPVYNESYAALDAKWVPIRPTTDIPLLLGIAHTLITEDNPKTNPLIDWEFLKKTSIGFDADSMPVGTDKKKNFKDYVLGTYDKQPKDAVWASERCGASVENIKMLAYELGVNNKVAFITSWSTARANNTDNLPQLFMTIGAMTGHMGKSGHMTAVCCSSRTANHGATLVASGSNGLPAMVNPVDDFVNDIELYDMILGKPYKYTGNCGYGPEWKPAETRTADIRMIFSGFGEKLQNRPDMKKGIEAYRKVEFVATATTFFNSTAMYSDIVLPVNTEWERLGGMLNGNREMIIVYSQVMESLYETKDDQWIAIEIGKRLGLKLSDMLPIDTKQQWFNQLAGATVVSEKGIAEGMEPLCTITEQDLKEWGVQGKPQQGRIPLNQLREQGHYQVKRYKGDSYGYIAFEEFRKNPEKNPSKFSQSGKFEIYSEELARKVNLMGYGKIDPIPVYTPPIFGYEDTFKDWKKKEKGEYPYQVVTLKYMKRSHTMMDNEPLLSEAFESPVFINAQDAKKEGIVSGNTIMLTSRSGSILRPVVVTQRVIPGVVVLFHGSWSNIDENTGIDHGGADNILTTNIGTGQGTTGYNSIIVKVSKYSDTSVPDTQRDLRMVNLGDK